jgi:hypothetical protein
MRNLLLFKFNINNKIIMIIIVETPSDSKVVISIFDGQALFILFVPSDSVIHQLSSFMIRNEFQTNYSHYLGI